MDASQSTISHAKNPAMATNDTNRVSKSHLGCTPRQQLVHSWEVLTWPLGSALTSTSLSGLDTRRLSYTVLSSVLEPSFPHSTHRAPKKAIPTMPKQTKSYQYTSSAMVTKVGPWKYPVQSRPSHMKTGGFQNLIWRLEIGLL